MTPTNIKSMPTDPWKYAKTDNVPKYTTECIDEFSLDSNANLNLGHDKMKYVYEELIGKRLNIDLLEGMARQVEKRRIESLDKIFHWLMATAAQKSSLKEALNGCQFVSRRGPLSRVAAAPYGAPSEHDNGQKVVCTKYKGVYFMREYADPEEKEKNWSDFQWKAAFAGRKFEQLMATDDPRHAPDVDSVVDPNEEFNGVFKALLTADRRPLNILCAGEIDAVRPGTDKREFVELKTQFGQIGRGRNFVYKALKWYLQSHLIGIKQFVIGYHQDFTLNRVEYFSLEKLKETCGGTTCPWKLEICLAFLHAFLEKIQSELDSLPEGTILVAERAPRGREYWFTVVKEEKENGGDGEYEVVSEEFKAHGWK